MCIGRGRAIVQPKPTFRDAPPVVTGSQTGVANPKDTKKATEQLKIKRQKKEGTYVDPNLSMLEKALTSGGRGGVVASNKRSASLRGKSKSSGRTGARG